MTPLQRPNHSQGNAIVLSGLVHGPDLGGDDVFTLIEDCRAYYTKVRLGADFVDQFIR